MKPVKKQKPIDTSSLKIEKGIPIASKCVGRRGNGFLSFLNTLEVGDSFLVERKSVNLGVKSLLPKRFVQRTVDGGVRIWRSE